jgi:hypothetical protein
MLTKGDDFPIHQLPVPISEVGTERNFYDRYFFNGYNNDGEIFFAIAMCVYPNLNLIDGSFVLVAGGIQHNFRYSRVLGQERMNTEVGALKVEVIEPLKKIKITIDDKKYDISASLEFEGRFEPVQEPRMTLMNGPKVSMDSTRLTQHGRWTGNINFKETSVDVKPEEFFGTRDRSWGIRPVGSPDAQPVPPIKLPQFYWLWAPANFEEFSSHVYFVDNESGESTHSHSVLQMSSEQQTEVLGTPQKIITYEKNSRRVLKAEFYSQKDDGSEVRVIIEPKYRMFMCGLGYMHPEWGHGMYRGDNESMYDSYDLSEDPHDPPFLHVQAISDFTVSMNGQTSKGIGVLEELLIGKHKPSGFEGLLDR